MSFALEPAGMIIKVAPYSFNSTYVHLKKDEELKMNYLFQLWV